ncbi:hypothetical protein BDW59DRAFT_174595 [Aspergillus cavernicola]|uniref:BZIP domain-containing protein n=1 Tax=Aspergillus cavernicola TaxID=176166 RepID=A0ABR4HXM3_9EURO
MPVPLHSSTPNESEGENVDDWRGITDRCERRRRQNRVNQRTYMGDVVAVVSQWPTRDIDDRTKHQILRLLSSAAYQRYLSADPAVDQLLSLTRANVYRAFLTNIALLGLPVDGLCERKILSPFNLVGPIQSFMETLPKALHPTATQRSLQHHPWVDFFPHAQIRDNLIRAQNRYDKHQFCLDILGFWDPGSPENMLLVWGEPYDPANWEVTESFIKKWGWVIQGCPDILYSSNRWRARRGENMIFRYL